MNHYSARRDSPWSGIGLSVKLVALELVVDGTDGITILNSYYGSKLDIGEMADSVSIRAHGTSSHQRGSMIASVRRPSFSGPM